MKRKSERNPAWVVDYSAARADAIRWLGDRYLLAKPINGKHDSWRKLPAALRSMSVEINDASAPRAPIMSGAAGIGRHRVTGLDDLSGI
jgi:hypothetical protein